MTVVVSGGKALPVGDRKAWPLAGLEQRRSITGNRSLDLIGINLNAEYAAIYAGQPWIYSLVNKVTRNIARLPLRSLREDPTTYQRTPLPRTHDLAALLSRPYPRHGAFHLVEATVGSLMVYGHALWWKYRARPGQPPTELWPLDWSRISIQAGEQTPIDYYEYRGLRGAKKLLPDDVVHFTWWSPAGLRGTSPLEPLRTTLQLEDAGRRYAIASFANGVRPSGALVSERALGEDAKKELKADIETVHSAPDNAFRMMLLEGGLTWQAFSHNAQEAQTIEHRKLNTIESCAVYDMPPPMVQVLDNATFSNIDEQHRMLYQDTMGPILGNIEATIGAQLLWGEPLLGAAVDERDGELENTLVSFDMSEILRADIVKRAAAYAAFRAAGGYSINDIRRMEGLAPIDHPAADAVLIPLNMLAVADGNVTIEMPTATGGPTGGAAPGTAALTALADALAAKSTEDGVEPSILAGRMLEALVTV